GEEAEEHERQERRKREEADREGVVRQLEQIPAEREPLHPRPDLRHELSREEQAVVPVAEARERASHVLTSSSSRRASGPIAYATASSSAGSSLPRRDASQAVRRERTRRSTRAPTSVSVSPTRRLSSALGVRSTSPSRSRRSTWFDIAGAETRSRVASAP